MGAPDYKNPNLSQGQFQTFMFAPAGRLASGAVHHMDMGWDDRADTVLHDDTPEKLGERKVRAAKATPSRYESIAKEGVKRAVTMHKPLESYAENPDAKPELYDGHHRVFSQNDVNPQAEVPVKWYDPQVTRHGYSQPRK